MTRLLHATVEGLAGRRKAVEVAFQPDLNIFYGLNGTGKTSLLRLLYSCLKDDISQIRRVPFEFASITFEGDDKISVTREISADSVGSIQPPPPHQVMTATGAIFLPQAGPQHGWQSTTAAGFDFNPSYLSIFRLFGDPIQTFWGSGPESPYSETRLDQQFVQLVLNKWVNYSNQLLSRVRALQDEGVAAILESLFLPPERTRPVKGDAGGAYEQVVHFMERRGTKLDISKQRFVERYDQDQNLQRAVSDIEKTEQLIEQTEEPRRRLEELLGGFLTNKRIEFSEPGIQVHVEDGDIGLDLLSSGEKHILRILIECLAARSNCLIIDEPELSLHIDWQRALADSLHTINPNAQAILATHSPDIMAEVPDNRIIKL